ncbi:MAG: NAD(P)/FAD-dependent oxidoreductase [Candidatus Bathyarchaeota archaeon]|nr:MAG: NAD(P)/FAD-dependent oxidoreductase [Candidatus Bathyarchaeota archaeon]
MNSKFKVVTVGSGLGSLCTSAVLAKESGLKPTVFEKKSNIGGSFGTYDVDSFLVDTGAHLLTRGTTGELPQLLRRYVSQDIFATSFAVQEVYNFTLKGRTSRLPRNLPELLDFRVLPRRERLQTFRLLLKFLNMGREGTKEKSSLTTYELVESDIVGEDMYFWLNAMAWMCSGSDIHHAPASRIIDTLIRNRKLSLDYVLKHSLPTGRASEEDYYPIGGAIKVPNLLIDAAGLDVRTKKEVKKICVEDGVVKGVEVENEFYPAQIVIYGGLLRELPSLVGRKNFPKEDTSRFSGLKEYYGLSLWLGFDKEIESLNRESLVRIEESTDPPKWAIFTSDFDPELAPKGKLLVVSTILTDKPRTRQIDQIEKAVEEALPGYEKHVVMRHEQICLAEKCLQDKERNVWTLPEQKTRIDGLYVVGTDTAGWGNGGNLCADSAFKCLDFIRQDYPELFH